MEEQIMTQIKEIFDLFAKNPSAMLCTLCMIACGVIYNDAMTFIDRQAAALEKISETQQTIAVELREINTRLNELEKQAQK